MALHLADPGILNLFINLEILREQEELRQLGLSEEEIIGYTEFFISNYYQTKEDEQCLSKSLPAKRAEPSKRSI